MKQFESICRIAYELSEEDNSNSNVHPFITHNIHEKLPHHIKKLFDNAHYTQATFEACKYLDKVVSRISSIDDSGKSLMMQAFNENNPKIRITNYVSDSERNEQEGYKFIFAGLMIAVRNIRGHEYLVEDDINTCLEHLTMISHLLRKIEQSNYNF
jgi:uncharacterized protein (TIGR02391 family)